jgi:ABC-type bacteriocin/lantibiotic exporter with double-glycine peptidase domain
MSTQAADSEVARVRLRFIFETTRPFRRRTLVVLALILADTTLASLGVGIVLPVFQALLDPEHDTPLLFHVMPWLADYAPERRLLILALGTVGLFFVKACVAALTSYKTNELLLRMRAYWMTSIGENYLYGKHAALAGRKQGELLNDWFNEPLAASRFFHAYLSFFSSSILALAMLLLGLMVSWQATLSLIVLGSVLLTIGGSRLYGGAARLSKIKMETSQSISASMVENLATARDLKLMLAERVRLGQLDRLYQKLKSSIVRGQVWAEMPRIGGEFFTITALMVFVLVAVGWRQVAPQQILPVMAFFFVAFYRLIGATSLAVSSRMKALHEVHSLHLVQRLIDRSLPREQREGGEPLSRIETDIRFEDIDFSYVSDRPALIGVNAVLPLGKLTYILGPSGSGKSTLLDVLLRLIEPDRGRIVINGCDASLFNLAQWRRCFGYVSQDPVLFNGSLRMNLLLAKPNASDHEIREACRLAGAEEFIDALPETYDTLVGDRGQTLSGGQRKRLAIARALIGAPQILILDEATTSFEQSLERDILDRLKAELPLLTVVQVTHRIQAVQQADWIIGMHEGRVVATGQWSHVGAQVSRLFDRSPEYAA